MKQSQHFDGKQFINPIETQLGLKSGDAWDTLKEWITGDEIRRPPKPLPVIELNSSSFNPKPLNGLRVSWMGHSTVLIEIDGQRILTDPIWSKRCSPSRIIGPVRFHPPPLSIEDLPELDAVLISHDHYDHLEKDSICTLAKRGIQIYLPLGVGAHLEKWGINSDQFVELDWWKSVTTKNNEITFIATPARHFSGRSPFRVNPTLWCSWVIIGPEHRVFFSGDSGMFDGFEEIGEQFGPFNLTLMKIGAYGSDWPDIHINPEEAVKAHQALHGDVLLPTHWGTFNLAFHDWNDPIKRLIKSAETESVRVVAPRSGQIISIDELPPLDSWWE